ncbi:carboxyl-terminal processing protease [Ardenticatena maritima]|uniref:Carboxyl-terminal processing protease n=1 Tax=Ardenticatena maritima TaxID=872965 RepID=A0A0M8K991_9CHLR|nr:S41 family peptidase [Ardenticatena maritima]GAP64413.1 carboxyl-terminal processing protease [Ardenticatena maritima]
MEKALRIILIATLSAFIVVIAFGLGFAARGVAESAGILPPSITVSAETPAEAPPNFNIFWEAWEILKREYFGDLPDDQTATYGAIRGVLQTLGDPNTVLIEPRAAEREQEQLQGEFGGIGAYVSVDEQGRIVIVAPIDDTPAARAGLRADDIIIAVDGVEVTGMPLDEVVNMIRGPLGTEVTLTIFRPGVDEPFDITLTRDRIPDPTVAWQMVEGQDGMGYIRISFFSARTPEELRKAIGELKDQGADRLIIDLRNNPGGLLDSAIAVASEFIDEGVIVYQQAKDGSRTPFEARKGGLATDIPLVVLVNEGSASASEIVAGAIRDHGRGKLVGTQTFGKGTVQIPFELSDGASLHVTIAHWLTPNGTDLSGDGLTPDIWVDEDPNAQEDVQFLRAIDVLNETTGR